MADLVASSGSAGPLALPSRTISAGGGSILERVRAFTDQPAIQRSLPMAGLFGVVAAAALAWAALSAPAGRDLFTGLGDADKASVAGALDTAGIPYEIDRETGTLSVPEDDYHRARMLLAAEGLPKSAPDGEAMLTALPMGASRAVEGERLRGAREMDLARTIEAIDAVENARVHLAVSQPSVFLRDEAQAAASVMLKLRAGRALSEAQVRAITHLVASSVPGLSPDGVSVVDQSGKLLSAAGGDANAQAADRQVEVQNRIEARYMAAIDKLLTPLVGSGNFATEVHADLDFAEVQATRESFPKETQVVRAETGSWTKEGGPDAPASGIPGALSNMPPPAAEVAATQPPAAGAPAATAEEQAARTSENYNRTFELGREISVTRNPVGTVRRLSVAVALKDAPGGKPRSPAEVAALELLVKGAVGFDQARGDMIAISARNFAAVDAGAALEEKWWDAPWIGLLARNISALFVAAILIFGFGKPLMKNRSAAAERRQVARDERNAALGQEMQAMIATEAVASGGKGPVTLAMIEAAPGYAARAELIRNFVRQDPARAALVVRDLIRSDLPGAEARNG